MYDIYDNDIFKYWKFLLKNDKIADIIIIFNNDKYYFKPVKIELEKN